MNPLLILISGPSGVGKDAVIARLKELGRPYHFVVTATTRASREGEIDDVHYQFMTQPAFDALLAEGGFLEHATVYGGSYGVPKHQIAEALSSGSDVILRVDVQGARTLRTLIPAAVLVFVAPASRDELQRRLTERSTETPASLSRRLKLAAWEMEQTGIFDYLVVNEDGRLDEAAATIDAIVTAEHARVVQRRVTIE